MTREEAVLILTRLEKGCDEYAVLTNYAKEALQMAITALEADNVVERIAYMSQLNGGANYFDAFTALSNSIKRNGEKSEALQTDGDTISRQAAIGEVAKWMLEYGGEDEKRERVALGHVANGIKKLPSVQPEIIHCRDCRYSTDFYQDGCCYCKRPSEEMRYIGEGYGFYCAGAKRRTDE